MTSTEQLIERFITTLVSLGSSVGNQRLLEILGWQDSTYQRIKLQLIEDCRLVSRRGRGGSVALVVYASSPPKPNAEQAEEIKRQPKAGCKGD